MLGAKIGGNLDCSRGKFINSKADNSSTKNEIHALDTSLAEVRGKVCFKSFRVIGHVLALEMKVSGDFDCTGSIIVHKKGNCHAVSIDRSSIGGSVLLCQGFSATGQVRLIGTTIAGDLDCSGGKFKFSPNKEKDTNALYAPRAKVDGTVLLCGSKKDGEPEKDFETDGTINLEFTNINHSIKVGKDNGVATSIFRGGGVYLRNAEITGSLEWIEVWLIKEIQLNLHGATVGRLVTKGEKSWPNLWLDGFVYDRIEHLGLENNYKTYLEWLKKQEISNPQIYEQLATVLHQNGQDADAVRISMEKEKIKLKPKGSYRWLNPLNWIRCLWSLIYYITLGYGYKTHRALFGPGIFIILGWCIFCQGCYEGIIIPTNKKAYEEFKENKLSPSYTAFEPLVYYFDAFLPIGKLQQQEKWLPDDYKQISIPIATPIGTKKRPHFTLRYYLYFHTVMGWSLTTLGIAGLLQTIVRNK